jgi:hypothetical protein
VKEHGVHRKSESGLQAFARGLRPKTTAPPAYPIGIRKRRNPY